MSVCPVPTLRAIALSKSLPTPTTQELFLVVVRVAVGAPEAALAPPTAPMAPDPLDPEASAPVKLTTIIDERTLCETVAVTVALERIAGEKARQISAVPLCAFVRLTSAQVRDAPVTPVTVVLAPDR